MNFEKVGGRKLIATVLVLAAGGVLVATNGDVPDNYLVLLQTALGAFVGGNAVSKIVAAVQGRGKPASAQETTPGVTEDLVNGVITQNVAIIEKLEAQQELLVAIGQATNSVNQVLLDAKKNRP